MAKVPLLSLGSTLASPIPGLVTGIVLVILGFGDEVDLQEGRETLVCMYPNSRSRKTN